MNENTNQIREAVGIFDNQAQLQATIDMLSVRGFDRNEISVIGSESAMKEKFLVAYPDPKYLADNPKTPRSVNITTEEIGVAEGAIIGVGILAGVTEALIAAGGILAPTVIPATIIGITAGGVLGGIVAKYFGDSHAERLQKQIDNGGIILWVQTNNMEKENIAVHIMKQHGAKDLHIHEIMLEGA